MYGAVGAGAHTHLTSPLGTVAATCCVQFLQHEGGYNYLSLSMLDSVSCVANSAAMYVYDQQTARA